jgi:RHS repeat-associated protein
VYGYYRQLVIDQGFLASDDVSTCQAEHSGASYGYLEVVADPNRGPVTEEGYTVYFQRNPQLDLFGDGCSLPPLADIFAAMNDQVDELLATYDTPENEIDITYSQASCSCENLHQLIEENDLADELAANNYTAVAAGLNDIVDPSALNSGYYTASELQDWLATCSLTVYTMADLEADNFPPDLACAPETSEVGVGNVNELLQQECEAENGVLAQTNANIIYAAQLGAATQAYASHYATACLSKLKDKESFLVNYDLTEYHYTLYYYDQAGNLVKTVPPEGVQIIISPGDLQDVTDYRAELPGSVYTPAIHGMITNYKYNSLQNLTRQVSPDITDTTRFYYDYLGRLVLSRNARQNDPLIYATQAWGYTLFDALGRPYESGQVINSTAIPSDFSKDPAAMATWMSTATQKQQVVTTTYDQPLTGVSAYFPGGMQNIRGRVTSITYEAVDDGNSATWDNGSHFSYDIHGNVHTLITEFEESGLNVMFRKTTTYEYDLISGNVNAVHYQDGQFDEFHHRYEYDANNRVTVSYSSRDGVTWEKEAKNFYYATGQLLRMEIGDKIVQAMDYAYTAQGWIKGMNAGSISATRDIGKDSYSENVSGITSQNRDVALDAAGFVLGFYDGGSGIKSDYWSPAFAGQATSERFVPVVTSAATLADYNPLYNGNISKMTTALTSETQSPLTVQLTAYKYDQLNRIKQVRAHRNYTSSTNTFAGSSGNDGKYQEDFSYDRNGNILTVDRNGNNTSSTQVMDDFTYYYYDKTGAAFAYSGAMPLNATNKLAYVTDGITNTNYTTDIDNQSTGNYEYDGIGNLISDASEEIENIDWYANGKIKSITRIGTSIKSDLEFIYDAGGNRICKIVKPRNGSGVKSQFHWTYTYYVRDARGNVLAVYDRNFSTGTGTGNYKDNLVLSELDIYASKRLGVLNASESAVRPFQDISFTDVTGNAFSNPVYTLPFTVVPCTSACVNEYSRTLGKKSYEVSNHLDNVLATVSDRKLAVDNYSYSVSGSGSYKYDAVRNSYYAVTLGTGTHNRNTSSADLKADWYTADVQSYSDYYAFGSPMVSRHGGTYRYTFNGKEKVDEYNGNLDFGARIYDSRLGRWLSVDPLQQEYAGMSSYNFVCNTPVQAVDPDGKLVIFINGQWGPTFGYPTEGGRAAYWRGWDQRAMNAIGDHRAMYFDGGIGGETNTFIYGPLGYASNLYAANRTRAGYEMGEIVAPLIISLLQRDPNDKNHITESIKFITHSMGTAFERGMSNAIQNYVNTYNMISVFWNNNPKNKGHERPILTGFTIEFTIDMDPYQGSSLLPDPNARQNYFMWSDDSQSPRWRIECLQLPFFFDNFVGSKIPGSKQIGLDKNGNTMMHKHYIGPAPITGIPRSSMNSTGKPFKWESGSLFYSGKGSYLKKNE